MGNIVGQPLDETRQTRFPSSQPLRVESQQANLRELEEAIVYLQQKVDALENRIKELEA